MIRIITILLLFVTTLANAQWGKPRWQTVATQPPNPCPVPPCPTVNLSIPAIADNTLFDPAYGSMSRWNLEDGVKIVAKSLGPPRVEYEHTAFYFRVAWSDCESSTVQGNYSSLWTGRMRARVTEALNNGQLFAFGVMQRYPEICTAGSFVTALSYDGACSSYPEYVHDMMQGNANPDWNDFNDGTTWIEAANNPQWQARWAALHQAIMNWMDTAVVTPTAGPRSGQAINVKNALAYVDIRGHGSYGEWHNCCLGDGYDDVANWPEWNSPSDPGTYPTVATFKSTIDAQVNAYANYPCVIIINAMDGLRFNNTRIPTEVAAYILTKTNNFGLIGFRRDQWGDDASYYHQILEDNNQTFGGIGPFKDSVVTRYKWNYFTGEMPGYSNCQFSPLCLNGVQWGYLPGQARTLHPTWVGNGNWGGNAPTASNSLDSVRAFYRLNGPRVTVMGGTMTATLQVNGSFNVTLSMQNRGNATIHRAWTTQLILKNSGGTTVWTGTHTFQVKRFNPIATATDFSTDFTLSGVSAGSGYNLYIKLVDPLNYAQPFYLANTGRDATNGDYLIRSNITVAP